MRDTDLLASYDQWQHVERGLASVLRRLQRPEILTQVKQASADQVDRTDQDLARFYPQLRQAWRGWNAFDVYRWTTKFVNIRSSMKGCPSSASSTSRSSCNASALIVSRPVVLAMVDSSCRDSSSTSLSRNAGRW